MKFISKMMGFFENHHRHNALNQLRALPERQLRDCGISPELLEMGVSAWPWRAPTDESRVQPLNFGAYKRAADVTNRAADTTPARQTVQSTQTEQKDAA